ncbi:13890_t:CDS:2 [Cetraspora pellucida]|uniref:13890_t:CDS:1 n=1 Tax=Cetraspora pellucida TaxID=1433469 RepID=A0A9N9EUG1_9GLOM|nr:13890_t:CDS:2 [Cetraspora pellucida]
MLPPPSAIYESIIELFQSAQTFTNSQGYVLVKKRTCKDQYGNLKNMTLHCDRGGIYSSSETHQRQTNTQLINCPFELYAIRYNNLWYIEVRNIRVTEITTSGSRPMEIISTIHQNDPSALAISKDIYNAHQQLCKRNLAGRTPVKALIDELKESNYMYEYKCDDIDEDEEDYLWVLTCITKLFNGVLQPKVIVTDRELALMNALNITFLSSANLLCLWHINKNIMKNCKSRFETVNEWQAFLSECNNVVYSQTEDEFNIKWENFLNTYTNKPHIINYLKEIWMPWKEKFVKAWTNKFFHLGATITSRVESTHATIKTYLHTLAGALYDVHVKISLAVENQKKEIDTMIASEKIRSPIFAQNSSLYENGRGKISNFALKKVNEHTMGLLCAHRIQLLENHQGLMLDDFHEHWWIQARLPIPPVETNIPEIQPLFKP